MFGSWYRLSTHLRTSLNQQDVQPPRETLAPEPAAAQSAPLSSCQLRIPHEIATHNDPVAPRHHLQGAPDILNP